mmetsp:Transcript_7305/g.21181  ORF Transcript_7305/g.21181 Transcript_7305/m.21181 type:complete len:84 (-) Transcript_7305:2069-2320(-)
MVRILNEYVSKLGGIGPRVSSKTVHRYRKFFVVSNKQVKVNKVRMKLGSKNARELGNVIGQNFWNNSYSIAILSPIDLSMIPL